MCPSNSISQLLFWKLVLCANAWPPNKALATAAESNSFFDIVISLINSDEAIGMHVWLVRMRAWSYIIVSIIGKGIAMALPKSFLYKIQCLIYF
ncbi:hypothetical protein KUL152_31850 [Tenacibaculum sp. KUL152]|nr:hypothetical protein KUL152_31850 [Tenacibaculum sp. KUL152]